MRAVVQDSYGPPDTLRITDVPDPEPGAGEVLVEVAAASVNPGDWHVLRGDPRVARLALGLRRPRRRVAGQDGAGTVVAVGSGVTGFEPGDRVFGYLHGAWGERSTAEVAKLAHVPDGLDLVAAASLPIAGTTGLRAIAAAGTKPGDRVLIVGASGGVGSAALQVAVHRGAEVTAVCSTANVDLVRDLGAHAVVDYTRDDVLASRERYDVVLDNAGVHRMRDLRALLVERGTLLVNGGGGPEGKLVGSAWGFAKAGLLNPFVRHRLIGVPPTESGAEVAELAALVEAGALRTVVSEVLDLDRAIEAVARVESGHTRGKIVLRVIGRSN